MSSPTVPLIMLAGGAALVYVGITNPAAGGLAGLRNLLTGTPNTSATADVGGGVISDVSALLSSTPKGAGATGSLGSAAGTVSGRRAKVLDAARTWLGVPYAFGGNTRRGIDCSGLTLQCYAAAGIHLPRVSFLQARRGKRTLSPQPGDLVCFGSPVHHVGIYLGGGQMIDAPHPGTVVRVEAVDYGVHPIVYRNLFGDGGSKHSRKPKGTQA